MTMYASIRNHKLVLETSPGESVEIETADQMRDLVGEEGVMCSSSVFFVEDETTNAETIALVHELFGGGTALTPTDPFYSVTMEHPGPANNLHHVVVHVTDFMGTTSHMTLDAYAMFLAGVGMFAGQSRSVYDADGARWIVAPVEKHPVVEFGPPLERAP
jgi:hypothetical protein